MGKKINSFKSNTVSFFANKKVGKVAEYATAAGAGITVGGAVMTATAAAGFVYPLGIPVAIALLGTGAATTTVAAAVVIAHHVAKEKDNPNKSDYTELEDKSLLSPGR